MFYLQPAGVGVLISDGGPGKIDTPASSSLQAQRQARKQAGLLTLLL